MYSREKLGSAQIHVEFAIPYMPQAKDQARGNSGVLKGNTSGGATDNPRVPGSLMLQDYYHPDVRTTFMRYRNIWYRPLAVKD